MNKKLVAVPLLVAIGLSICGFVYAHWTATVYINGNATTGYLMLGFYKKFPAEPPKYTEYWLNKTSGESVEGEYLGKDVGSGSAGLSGPIYCPQTGLSGYSELDITVNNAYPGYMPHVTFNLENLGTIPVDLKKFIITGEKRDSTGTTKLLNLTWDGNNPGYLWEDVNKDHIIDDGDIKVISIYISNSLPVQYDPHNIVADKREIDLDFEEGAEQCHVYTIHVTVVGIQWDKVNDSYP
jgi:hypothetical protein